MGDGSFYGMMADLADARHPLIEILDTPQHGLGVVSITATGRNVLEGGADHVALNGIDRWLGGAHLKGEKVPWRWNPTAGRLVSP